MRHTAAFFRPLALAAALVLSGVAAPSYAFSDSEARNAILELRQQFRQMNDQNNRARLQLADQINSLQQEVMQLRDQLELVSREQSRSRPAAQGAGAGQQEPRANDPQEQAVYDAAIDQFRTGQYKDAGESLAGFVSMYPNSALAPQAQFYLGSSRFALKDFKGAITQMQSLIQATPNFERAPDALLVIAGSQIELNNRAGAKATLQQLVRDYPNANAAETARNRLQLLQ